MSSAFALRDQNGTESSPRGRASRWARPLVVALGSVCALLLAGRFIAEPVMQIRHVVVRSDLPLADDQVLALSGVTGAEHWYSVTTPAIEKRLEANPLVRRAEVVKVFPDTLRMTVWGRVPAGLVLASVNGRTVPVLVDSDGVVYKIGSSGAEVDMPVVSGVSAGETTLGSTLPRVYGRLFADLLALRETAPALYALVSEVRVVGAQGPDGQAPAGFDVLLYLTCSPVPVRAGGTVDEGLIRSTLMVLDLLSRQGVLQTIQELDFRSGDVVYRTKGR
jgi:cell division protein FtsQ